MASSAKKVVKKVIADHKSQHHKTPWILKILGEPDVKPAPRFQTRMVDDGMGISDPLYAVFDTYPTNVPDGRVWPMGSKGKEYREVKKYAKRINAVGGSPEFTEYKDYQEKLLIHQQAQAAIAAQASWKIQAYTPSSKTAPSGAILTSHTVGMVEETTESQIERMVKAAIDKMIPQYVKSLRGEVADLQEQIDELWQELRDGT